jgi:ABC-2 type transport system permease protein
VDVTRDHRFASLISTRLCSSVVGEQLSGIFIPLGDNSPSWILWIARIFPIRHFANGMQAGFLGTSFHWSDVLVVAAWGLGGLAVATRYFNWEPPT